MRFQYRIYQSEESKPALDRFFHPFTEERQLYEYDHFDTALHLHEWGSAVQASSEPAKPTTAGVVVTLITDLPENDADQALVQFLVKHNNAIPGLCLTFEKVRG